MAMALFYMELSIILAMQRIISLAKFILLIYVLFINLRGFSQIINVERQRIITDTSGWSGDIVGTFTTLKINKAVTTFDFNSHLQYKSGKNIFLLFGNYNLINAGGENFDNSGFTHFRYNRKITKMFIFEAFYQIQLNKLLKIESRNLYGFGPRIKILDKTHARAYLSTILMYEHENITSGRINRDLRSSNYCSFTIEPSPNFTIRNTLYYQPLYKDITDFRISSDAQLIFKVLKNVSFSLNYHFLQDSNPADLGISKTNYSFSNSLQFHF
jgi:hypothetical protein